MAASTAPAGSPAPTSSPARRLRLPSARAVATRSPAPASPANVSLRPPFASASCCTSEKIAPGRRPGQVGPARRGGRRRERGGVLGAGGQLGTGHVVGGLHARARRPRAPRPAGGAGPGCGSRGPPTRPARSPRARARVLPATPPRGRARARPRTRRAWCRAAGRGPWRPPARRCARPRARRSRRPRPGASCTARPAPRGPPRRTPRRAPRAPRSPRSSGTPGQVLGVLALGSASALRLLAGAAAELHLQSRAREHHGRGGAHRACAHHGRGAQRRQPAEPLPLELHAGPDPLGHLAGQEGRRAVHARERERRPEAQVHLHRPDPPAAPGALAAGTPRSGPRGRRSRAPAGPRRGAGVPSEPRLMRVPSGKITTASPRSSSAQRGLRGLLVGLAALDGEARRGS